jgi:sugar phosphate isomerase/epimerase
MASFPIGILGWTGLVGQTLFHQLLSKGRKPTEIATYNSKNLTEIRGVAFDTLYICCMPATKWWANLYPDEDLATLNAVLASLATVRAERVILLSTVDVLQSDSGGNEESEAWVNHPYGRHRRLLEIQVQSQWPTTSHILRLPALFGRGLKKNALYDLIHDNNVAGICLDSEFQWYNLAHLLRDCESYSRMNVRVAHLASPPIPMREIVTRWFTDRICSGLMAVKYNLTTGLGGTPDGPYTSTKEKILQQMGEWIAWELWRKSHLIAASNIGFTMSKDVQSVLHHMGISYLEIAPTKGTDWADFQPISAQSLIYGTPITNIFHQSTAFLEHLQKLMESAAAKGIRTFVFGSPRQRALMYTNWTEAVDLFQKVGALGAVYHITVCVEPNATAYGCTWLTNIADALRFVQAVDHPNIRLSLDSGNYSMEGDNASIADIPLEWIGHLQVSAAHLGSELSPTEQMVAGQMVGDLWSRGYRGAISYEAKEPAGGFKEYCKGLGQFMDLLEYAAPK